MREPLHLAHNRIPHLLGADELAAFRLDVGGAQKSKLFVHILLFHDESARTPQPEAVAFQSEFSFHLSAFSLPKGINQDIALILLKARDVNSPKATFDQRFDSSRTIKSLRVFGNLRNNTLKLCVEVRFFASKFSRNLLKHSSILPRQR